MLRSFPILPRTRCLLPHSELNVSVYTALILIGELDGGRDHLLSELEHDISGIMATLHVQMINGEE